jgi:hypothetical protein
MVISAYRDVYHAYFLQFGRLHVKFCWRRHHDYSRNNYRLGFYRWEGVRWASLGFLAVGWEAYRSENT